MQKTNSIIMFLFLLILILSLPFHVLFLHYHFSGNYIKTIFKNMLKQLTQITLGLLLWLLISPILLPVLLFFSLWKFIVLIYIKFRFTNSALLFEPTNIPDTICGLSDCACMIGYAFVGQGIIDLDKLRTHFYDTFIKGGKDRKFAVFHYTFTSILGYTFKTRAPLDLNNHIREENYNAAETENEAVYRISKNNSKLYGFVPKWEIVLLQNRKEAQSTLILKISHGLVDAYSVRILLGILTDNQTSYKTPKGALPQGLLYQANLFAKLPFLMLLNFANLKKSNMHMLGYDHAEQNINPSFNRYWSRTTIDFNILKKISTQSSCQVISIIHSLYLSTLKKTLAKLGKWDNARIPNDATIMCPLPAPNHPADNGKFCTHCGIAFINLPLKEDNAIKQLELIQKRVMDYETSEIGPACVLFGTIFGPVLPTFLIKSGIFPKNIFYVMINPFIFSPMEYSILGVRLTNLYFLTTLEEPLKYRGTTMTPLTRGNQMDLTVHGSDDVFNNQADADLFMQIMKEEVDNLAKDVENRWRQVRKVRFQ